MQYLVGIETFVINQVRMPRHAIESVQSDVELRAQGRVGQVFIFWNA
jgi:hypothetical protein